MRRTTYRIFGFSIAQPVLVRVEARERAAADDLDLDRQRERRRGPRKPGQRVRGEFRGLGQVAGDELRPALVDGLGLVRGGGLRLRHENDLGGRFPDASIGGREKTTPDVVRSHAFVQREILDPRVQSIRLEQLLNLRPCEQVVGFLAHLGFRVEALEDEIARRIRFELVDDGVQSEAPIRKFGRDKEIHAKEPVRGQPVRAEIDARAADAEEKDAIVG